MRTFIIFDNRCATPDRYTIIDQQTGDVFGCGEDPDSPTHGGRLIGNCAAHCILLHGAGWRQKMPAKKVLKEEIDNYINNARLDPNWLGGEVNLGVLPDGVRRWVARLASRDRAENASKAIIAYLPGSSGDAIGRF